MLLITNIVEDFYNILKVQKDIKQLIKLKVSDFVA